jgi:glycosyltransferase involved in cell wall biosynthesis
LGGGEISFFELMRKIDKNQFEPIAIVPEEGEVRRKILKENIQVKIVKLPSFKNIYPIENLVQIFRFVRVIKKNKIDLIHINGQRACIYGGIASKLIGIPAVLHVREAIRDLFIVDWILASLVDKIICVSKSVQIKRFKRFNSRVNNKIEVVYNGVETDRFILNEKNRNEARRKLKVNNDEILFGLIGNFIPRKAQHLFLNGLSAAMKKRPMLPVKVLIVGRKIDLSYIQKLNEIIDEQRLHSIVSINDFTTEILPKMSALDVFVLTSESEGFCRSLIEVMSIGLPVIATRLSEIEEAVDHNENAILVDNKNVDEIANAIITMSELPDLRKKMGRLNRKKAMDEFNLNDHVTSIQKIYKELLPNAQYDKRAQSIPLII